MLEQSALTLPWIQPARSFGLSIHLIFTVALIWIALIIWKSAMSIQSQD